VVGALGLGVDVVARDEHRPAEWEAEADSHVEREGALELGLGIGTVVVVLGAQILGQDLGEDGVVRMKIDVRLLPREGAEERLLLGVASARSRSVMLAWVPNTT
jgi:hypothetical protein